MAKTNFSHGFIQMSTEKKQLIIIGGGEHAKVVLDAAKDSWNVLGYIDREKTALKSKCLGQDESLPDIIQNFPNAAFIWGTGSNELRSRLAKNYSLNESKYAVIVHPLAIVSDSAIIEPGVFVAAGTIVQPDAVIGAHSIVNTGAIIEHDCIIGEFSHIAPGAVMGGRCIIGPNSLIGLGSRIKDHITIGENSIVGAGSVVIANIEQGSTVVGIPAKLNKK